MTKGKATFERGTTGICLTAYDAETDTIAEKTAYVDRQNPKKECNGYPFSRMKISDKSKLN